MPPPTIQPPSTTIPKPTSLSLLTRAHSPTTAQRLHTERVHIKPLHLTPTSVAPSLQETRRLTRESAKSLKKRKRALKPAPLSSRQRKALSIHSLPKKVDYEVYIPLHDLWMRYVQDLLGVTTRKGDGNGKVKRSVGVHELAKLCSADYHGARVEVVRSRCVSRVGIKGIVVKDGMRAFEIVVREKMGEKGKEKGKGLVKRVPKEGTWFAFEVGLPGEEEDESPDMDIELHDGEKGDEVKGNTLKFELHGDQFIYRAADRANRKFKTHFDHNL